MQFAIEVLTMLDVRFYAKVVSGHHTSDKLFSFAEQVSAKGFEVIMTGTEGALHLPSMLTEVTLIPGLRVPAQSATLSKINNPYSIAHMPLGILVDTLAIGKAGAANVGLLAA